MKKSAIGWIIAGATAAVGGVGIWLYERSKPAAAPATPANAATTPAAAGSTMPAPTPPGVPTGVLTLLPAGTTLRTGWYYCLSCLVPAGIATPQQMYDGIGQAGWTNQRVLWFGPTGYIDHVAGLVDAPAVNPSQLGPTSTLVFGVWNGADNTPFSVGVNYYRAG
jgi:hypothetical protein